MILTDGVHLASTASEQELHRFAQAIGLKREWFQPGDLPHYDMLSDSVCRRAAARGLTVVDTKELVRRMSRQ